MIRQKMFFISLRKLSQYQAPFLLGSTFNPNFWKAGYQKKMSTRRDLKSSCHGYLPGGLTIFLVKKRLKNKIWLWGLNFKCSFWTALTKQPINQRTKVNVTRNWDVFVGISEIGVSVIVKHVLHVRIIRAFCLPR